MSIVKIMENRHYDNMLDLVQRKKIIRKESVYGNYVDKTPISIRGPVYKLIDRTREHIIRKFNVE